jgi:hypothetical protein
VNIAVNLVNAPTPDLYFSIRRVEQVALLDAAAVVLTVRRLFAAAAVPLPVTAVEKILVLIP